MQNSKRKIYFIYNSKGNRVELGYAEIQALLFLNEHSFLSQPQLFKFYSLVSSIHPATFRKKTGSWLTAGLIKKKSMKLQNGHSVVIISLTNTGLNILKKLGYAKENIIIRTPSIKSSTIDHALAIREVVLDVITYHRDEMQVPIYLAKDLYIVDMRPNLSFNNLEKPVLLFKSQQFGMDDLSNFKPYSNIENYDHTLLISINPYTIKENEVVADWLFRINDNYLHLEVDSGFEQIRKSKKSVDTSIEGKLSRLQPQLNKMNIDPSRYDVLFVMINNRDDAVLTKHHTSRATRIVNLKQEIPCFADFDQWSFGIHVIQFSRVPYFLVDFFRKINAPEGDYIQTLQCILSAFTKKEQLQLEDWTTSFISKKDIIKTNTFFQNSYIPIASCFMENNSNDTGQFIIPFIMNEGDVKLVAQLTTIATDINRGAYYNLFTKILVIYQTNDQLQNDILIINNSKSKNSNAIDTSKMLFVSFENFNDNTSPPLLFNSNKKQISIDAVLDVKIPK